MMNSWSGHDFVALQVILTHNSDIIPFKLVHRPQLPQPNNPHGQNNLFEFFKGWAHPLMTMNILGKEVVITTRKKGGVILNKLTCSHNPV